MYNTPAVSLPEAFKSVIAQLQEEKYPELKSLSELVYSNTLAVQINDSHDAARRYSSLSAKLHQQVAAYLHMQRLVIAPYINDLLEKEDTGHDCATCDGGCNIRHAAHITDMNDAHSRMAEVLSWLHDASGNVTEFPEGWEALESSILQLETALTSVFLLEESDLIPMMIELQKSIGVHA